MKRIFRHADGRAMVAEEAGGTGGGVTSEHHRLATEDEVAMLPLESVEMETLPVEVLPVDTSGEIAPPASDYVFIPAEELPKT